MSDPKWIEISEDMSVSFSLPCRENYYYMRHVGLLAACDKPDIRHGHIELSCEDGYAFVRFPCYSQAGVKAALEYLGQETLSDQDRQFILDMEAVKNLPEELTEEEKLFIASLQEGQRMLCGWYS